MARLVAQPGILQAGIVVADVGRVGHHEVEALAREPGKPVPGCEACVRQTQPRGVGRGDGERARVAVDAEHLPLRPLARQRQRDRAAAGAEIEHARGRGAERVPARARPGARSRAAAPACCRRAPAPATRTPGGRRDRPAARRRAGARSARDRPRTALAPRTPPDGRTGNCARAPARAPAAARCRCARHPSPASRVAARSSPATVAARSGLAAPWLTLSPPAPRAARPGIRRAAAAPRSRGRLP